MEARIAWLCYGTIAYAFFPLLFRVRFGRWPFVYRRRLDAYTLIDFLYAGVLAAFTVALLAPPEPKPISLTLGFALFSAGCAWGFWAVLSMRECWRFGQRVDDPNVCYVTRGPFRIMRHPIYVSLVVISLGEGMLMGIDWRFVMLSTSTVVFSIRQSAAESRHWNARRVKEFDH